MPIVPFPCTMSCPGGGGAPGPKISRILKNGLAPVKHTKTLGGQIDCDRSGRRGSKPVTFNFSPEIKSHISRSGRQSDCYESFFEFLKELWADVVRAIAVHRPEHAEFVVMFE